MDFFNSPAFYNNNSEPLCICGSTPQLGLSYVDAVRVGYILGSRELSDLSIT